MEQCKYAPLIKSPINWKTAFHISAQFYSVGLEAGSKPRISLKSKPDGDGQQTFTARTICS